MDTDLDPETTAEPSMETDSGPLRVVLVVASVRTGRVADALLPWVRRELGARDDLEVDVIDLADGHDLPQHALTPGGTESPLSGRLLAADAFVLLVPEYNHSFPAPLKNLIDWHYTPWAGKPVTFVSYGAGSGGIRAVEQLRLVFPELKATTTRNVVALSAPWNQLGDGGFAADDGQRDAMRATLDELTWWADALRAARRRHGAP